MRTKTDSEIEQWVLRELGLSEQIRSREICIFARDGVVSLRGTAQSYRDKLAVEETVRRASGVGSVVNEMRVAPRTALVGKASSRVQPTETFRPGMLVGRSATDSRKGGEAMTRC